MRYLGNKTRLLGAIVESAQRLGFERGTVCDLFAGSGVVGRHFRSLGNRVISTDTMASSFVFQRVFLELPGPPDFAQLRSRLEFPEPSDLSRIPEDSPFAEEAWLPALQVVRYLEDCLPEVDGFVTRQYSPDGAAGRGYFRPETARRLDAILVQLRDWSEAAWVDEGELAFLLAATIDAADRVANISGTYGAFLKKWQPNAFGSVQLRLPRLVNGPVGQAACEDATSWIESAEADLLYMDPPYNQRQYPANYHLMEVLARLPREPDLASFEASIYGKTGLIPYEDKRSDLCDRRETRCRDAFRSILQATTIPRLVVSYSEEGIIARDDFDELLAEYAGVAKSRLKNVLTEVSYPRFRSDADGRTSTKGVTRQYRQLPGRARDEVREWLFHVKKQAAS